MSAYKALKKYCPEMQYSEVEWGYLSEGEKRELGIEMLTTAEGKVLNIKRAHEDSVVSLTLMDATAGSFTVDDGTTVQTVEIKKSGYAHMLIHSDCTVTINGGTANAYIEEKLHFNLWLHSRYELG